MDNQPDRNKDIVDVEYVEAEPIESGSTQPRFQSMPHIRTYSTNAGCVPCCGPFGCIFTLIILSYMFYEFEFVRAVAIAGIIFVVVSVFATSITRSGR